MPTTENIVAAYLIETKKDQADLKEVEKAFRNIRSYLRRFENKTRISIPYEGLSIVAKKRNSNFKLEDGKFGFIAKFTIAKKREIAADGCTQVELERLSRGAKLYAQRTKQKDDERSL